MYTIIVCYNCGQLLLAKPTQKTKQCTYCSTRLNLLKVKKVAYAKTAQEASDCLRVLKNKKK